MTHNMVMSSSALACSFIEITAWTLIENMHLLLNQFSTACHSVWLV